jgi:hypothetical protein
MTYSLNTEYSEACCVVELSPIRGKATVWFWGGGAYEFRKVSRRALLKAAAVDFFTGGLPSVGQWVNRELLAA